MSARGPAAPGATLPPEALPLLSLTPVDLARWDEQPIGDLMAVHIWSDALPLRGAAGLLDWRLCGRLSALLRAGRLTGAEGEQLLLPSGGRLPWRTIVVMGLGERAAFTVARFSRAIDRLMAAARGLGATDVAMALPGRDVEALPARRAFDLLMRELQTHALEASPTSPSTPASLRSLSIIESALGQKELAEAIRVATPGRARL